ncbi:MAG: SDR family oxidoreductase [Hyphomicrobiales bacterium]|nr:SDR family oxidoreductase [Hyphomicrobiales bacterium]
MPVLFCFGLGYSAEHYVRRFGAGYGRIAGTVRTTEKANRLAAEGFGGRPVEPMVFDARQASAAVSARLGEADRLLVSIGPEVDGDGVLAHFAEALMGAKRLRSIVYLSSMSVYGDHAGAWIDETTAAAPTTPRGRQRLAAERAWTLFGQRADLPVAILRLSGIYGPGRNALVNLKRGETRNVVKPGQVFNRIHAADIAQAIEAAFTRGAGGILNVTDDLPASRQAVLAYAASLLGTSPPAAVLYAELESRMSEMARSFYQESKRIGNAKLKRELGVRLLYPTYREGLRALFEDGFE